LDVDGGGDDSGVVDNDGDFVLRFFAGGSSSFLPLEGTKIVIFIDFIYLINNSRDVTSVGEKQRSFLFSFE